MQGMQCLVSGVATFGLVAAGNSDTTVISAVMPDAFQRI